MLRRKMSQIRRRHYAAPLAFLGIILLALALFLSIAIPHELDKLAALKEIDWLQGALTPSDLLPVFGVVSGLCVTCWTYLRSRDDERVERETLLESLVPLVQIIDDLEVEDWSWRFRVRNLGSQPLKTITLSGVPISQKLEEGSECSFRYLSNGSVLVENSTQTVIPSNHLDFIVEPTGETDPWSVDRLDFSIQCYDIKERHWVLSYAYTDGKIIETEKPRRV